jgi:hypothetical protein
MRAEEYWWFCRDEDDGEDRNASLTDCMAQGLLEGATLSIARRVIDEGVML